MEQPEALNQPSAVMATISETGDVFTQIVEFEVALERQDALIAAIVAEGDRWVRHCPGFMSATFHASHDGKRVINYAQWANEQAFRLFTTNPEAERLSVAIASVGPAGPPRATHCRVVRSVLPPAAESR